jgi:Pyruvate/2-oxoacid:ferredoxin oxidoreductase gamma subunit
VGLVDANTIAMEEINIQAPNTCMLGVFAATTKSVKLESIISGLEDYFEGKKLDGNIRCVQRGFEECKLVTY